MPSTFFGLNIARSGLYAASVNLNVTGNNIANEHTEGYSRQNAVQVAKNPIRVYEAYGMIGAGVEVTSIERTRDSFYDKKYWENQPKLEEANARYYYVQQIENHMNEFSVDGFTQEYINFFNGLEEWQKNPDDASARVSVLNYGESLLEFFDMVKTNLKLEQEDINSEVNTYVDRINTLATDLAALNQQINVIELTGASANELRDKRELLLDELSGICDIQCTEKLYDNGKSDFKIKIGSSTLVDNYDAFQLKVVSRKERADDDDAVGLYDIEWSDGKTFDVVSEGIDGTLKGLLEIRDGNNGVANADSETSKAVDTKGIPYFIDQLDKFLDTFTSEFNKLQMSGENLYGESTEDIPFFVCSENGVYSVNEELKNDPNKLASCTNLAQGVGNPDIVDKMLELRDAEVIESTSFEEYLHSLVTEISVEVNKQEILVNSYEASKLVIKNQRLSVMGVDADEEAMNLVKYQESFNLCAKMISVMQEIYDKLINETAL